MTTILLVTWVFTIWLGAYVQLRYAKSNYPRAGSWLVLRFVLSFVNDATLGALLFYRDFGGFVLASIAFLCGAVIGAGYTFLFPKNMQNLIPKHTMSEQNHRVK
jgi:hypothetical protein